MTNLSQQNELARVFFVCKTKEIFDAGIEYLKKIGYKKTDNFMYGGLTNHGNKINSIILNDSYLDSPQKIYRGNIIEFYDENNGYWGKWDIVNMNDIKDIENYLFRNRENRCFLTIEDFYI